MCVPQLSCGQEIAAISSSARKRLASSGLPRTSEDAALREIKSHARDRVTAGVFPDLEINLTSMSAMQDCFA